MNPWLKIPASDYEGHMEAVGQRALLGQIFRDVYSLVRPRRLAILGCATGNGFEYVDTAITERIVGVDINPDYIEIARRRFSASGSRQPAVSTTRFTSLQALATTMRLREPAEIDLLAAKTGLARQGAWRDVALPNEKKFNVALFSRG